MSFSRWTAGRLAAGFALLLAGSVVGPGSREAAARDRAEVEIKIATLAPEGSTWMKMMDELDAEIRERTNGEAGLKIYAGGIQGDETVVLRKIRAGQLHGGGFTGTGLGEIAPPLRVLEVPFTFKTIDEVRAVQKALGPRFEEILREAGWELLGWADVGFVYLFSKDPIRSVDDLKNSRMWLWEGDPLAETFLETVGISPVPLPITDVVTSLQTGLIDAVYTSPMACIALQWFTRVSSMTDLPVTYAMGAVVVRKKTFDKLSPEAQAVVKDASAKWFARLGESTAEENDESIAVLRDRGIEMIGLAPERKAAFEGVGREVRRELAGTLFDQELLDRMLAALERVRAEGNGSAPWNPGPLLLLGGVLVAGLLVHLVLRRRLGPERLETVSRRTEGTLFCAVLAAMILLSGLQVVLRNFFHIGLLWIDPLVRTLLLWVAFLGAFAAAGRARHIRIDVLGRLLPPRAGRVVERVLSALSAVVCLLLAEGGLTYVREEHAYGSPPFLGVPSWATQSILFWGFVLLAHRFLVQTFWPTPRSEAS